LRALRMAERKESLFDFHDVAIAVLDFIL